MKGISQSEDLVGTAVWSASSDRPVTSARTWLEVRDMMSKDVAAIAPGISAVAAAQMMAGNSISSILVTDGGRLVGILTETDLLMKVAAGKKRFNGIPVAEIMSSPVISVPASLSVLVPILSPISVSVSVSMSRFGSAFVSVSVPTLVSVFLAALVSSSPPLSAPLSER